MTDDEIFNALYGGGNYTLPYLLKFSHEKLKTIYLVNNNEDVIFQGNTFLASDFEYTPPDVNGSGGTLSISSEPNENTLFEFIENADYKYRLDIVGALNLDGTVTPLKQYVHFFGTVTIDAKGKITLQLAGDDRLDMTFTPYKFDTDNNRGNA